MATRKATLVLADAPVIKAGTSEMTYVIDRGEKGRDTVTVRTTLATDLRPISKRDALGAASIYDACDGWVKQEIRAAYAKWTADLTTWNKRLEQAVASGKGLDVVRLMRAKPVKPDLPDETADRIAPFVRFMEVARAAWRGARKHTLSVMGAGKFGKEIIWTGTLSSLTGKRPASGVIALGRRVR